MSFSLSSRAVSYAFLMSPELMQRSNQVLTSFSKRRAMSAQPSYFKYSTISLPYS